MSVIESCQVQRCPPPGALAISLLVGGHYERTPSLQPTVPLGPGGLLPPSEDRLRAHDTPFGLRQNAEGVALTVRGRVAGAAELDVSNRAIAERTLRRREFSRRTVVFGTETRCPTNDAAI